MDGPQPRNRLDRPVTSQFAPNQPEAVPPEVGEPVLADHESASALPTVDDKLFEYRRRNKPKKLKSRGWKIAKFVVLGLLLVGLIVGGWFGWRAWQATKNIFGNGGGAGALALQDNFDVTQLKGEGDGRVNILLLGIGGEGHEGPNLSDTIMVVSVDPKTKNTAMLSIPRDLYVKLPGVGQYATQYGKVNAANVYGGPEYASRVIQTVIGVPIHYFVVMDFSGFKQAVDAVGGVDINVPEAINDPEYPCDNGRTVCGFKLAAGQQHMNGAIALKYARSRKSTSDFDRAARQQQVIAALRDKSLQLSTLTNPVKLLGLIETLGTHVKSNLQTNEIKKLATVAKDIDMSKVSKEVLDTDRPESLLHGGVDIIPEAGYIEVPKLGTFSYRDIHDFVKNLFADGYILEENALVEVQNGSGIPGLAGTVTKSLKSAHYNLSSASNANEYYAKTVLYDYTGGQKPYTVNYLENRFKVKVQSAPAPVMTPLADGSTPPAPQIRIILGSDYSASASTN